MDVNYNFKHFNIIIYWDCVGQRVGRGGVEISDEICFRLVRSRAIIPKFRIMAYVYSTHVL
jgi:hypothetical protein